MFYESGMNEMRDTDKILLLGGSGFVGRHIVRTLAKTGAQIRVAVRHPNQALFVKTAGRPGQIEIIRANIRDRQSLDASLENITAVVNCVGILFETGKQKFTAVQSEGAASLAQAAAARGIEKFVQMSAIGADAESPSRYAQSKAAGEQAVLEAIPSAHILRPSLVIGPEDDFFNRFAAMSLLAPALPLIGGGKTRYQPVTVFDVAVATKACLEGASSGIYELGGPQIYSFKELMELLLEQIERRRLLLPMPVFAARIIAVFAQFAPKPLLTPDQINLLQSDNVVADNAHNLATLGIDTQPILGVLPDYLARYRPHSTPRR